MFTIVSLRITHYISCSIIVIHAGCAWPRLQAKAQPSQVWMTEVSGHEIVLCRYCERWASVGSICYFVYISVSLLCSEVFCFKISLFNLKLSKFLYLAAPSYVNFIFVHISENNHLFFLFCSLSFLFIISIKISE